MEASRRNLLGAIALAPIISIPAFPAFAATGDWTAALTAHRAARAKFDGLMQIHAVAEDAYWTGINELPPRPMGLVIAGTDMEGAMRVRREQERKYEAAEERIRRDVRYDETMAERDLAMDADGEALDRLAATPAPTIRDAILKIEILERDGMLDQRADHVLDDLRRLAGEARS